MPPDPFYTNLPDLSSYPEYIDGVFKGGGAGGVAYGGTLQALARNGVWFKRVAGTSAGAITAAIIAAGYDANEIDYIAAPEGTRRGPPSNLPAGVEPMNYYSIFIDPAVSPNDLRRETKQQNLVYEAIVGKIIDEVIKQVVPLPAIERFIDGILNEVIKGVPQQTDRYETSVGPFKADAGPFKKKILGRTISVGPFKISTPKYEVKVGPFPVNVAGIKPIIRRQLIKGLTAYPKTMLLGQSGLFGTEDLQRVFADAAIDSILLVNPWLTALLNFFAEGGLVRGNKFLEAIRKILEAKTGKQPTRFRDLTKIDLACVACDITDHEMRVYSTKTSANMEVAEAVRRSMAIPLFFEPRREGNHEIVDGGTMDNYPLGLYLSEDNGFFKNVDEHGNDVDGNMARVKFGFSPGTLGSGPGARVENYLYPGMPSLPPVELAFITRVFNLVATNLSDSPLFKAMLKEVKKLYKFHEIGINGKFSTFDFDITKTKYKGMCSKGWNAAIPVLQEAIDVGHFPNITSLSATTNPYS